MIPRYGRPPKNGQRYTLRPGAYAILPFERGLLVTHQAGPEPEYQLPGGGIDPGENPGQALRREVLEETGWSIGGLRRFGAFRRFAYMPEYDLWADKLCVIYIASPIRPKHDPIEADHSSHIVSAEFALDRLGNAGDRALLKRAISQRWVR
ncbi:NUDIX domain-containing protein [Roseobacteraceae bacterium S113]